MAFEEFTKLYLKRFSLVVLDLVLDVPDNSVRAGFTHREGAIPTLPMKVSESLTFRLYPLGGAGFDDLDDFGC